MKGCARSCILMLIGWVAVAYAFYAYFVRLHDFGAPMYWASAISGLCVIAVLGYATGIVHSWRERGMLLDALAGTPPEDGKWAAVSGTIQSTAPLTAPLSGARAVLYDYRISRTIRGGRKGGSTEAVYYEGKALAPSSIATRHGSVRLLSVPVTTELQVEPLTPSEALKHARAYIANTRFTIYDTGEKRTARLEEEWTDDDGVFRQDRQHQEGELALDTTFHFQERILKPGETICAFGLYSRERGGLIPHPNWSHQTRVTRGDATIVAAKLSRRIVWYFVGILFFSGVAYGIVRLYEAKAAALV